MPPPPATCPSLGGWDERIPEKKKLMIYNYGHNYFFNETFNLFFDNDWTQIHSNIVLYTTTYYHGNESDTLVPTVATKRQNVL